MRRLSDLFGVPVISSATGDRIGRAVDGLVRRSGDAVIGLVVEQGAIIPRQSVLPFTDIQTVGHDTIVTRAAAHLVDAPEWHARSGDGERSSRLKHRHVVTDGGRSLGTLTDVCIDEISGTVEGYVVTDSGFGGLISHHRMLRRPDRVTIGPDVMVVPDTAVPEETE